MSSEEDISESRVSECKPLLDVCTLNVYRYNAFRITGLFTDTSVRDIKRRIDDLKHADEMGNAEEGYSRAFALDPAPGLEHIREAALRLHDPERRIVEELFWFWPMKGSSGKNDPALLALAKGDMNSPYKTWTQALTDHHSEMSVISKHNLVVMYQMIALDGKLMSLEKDLTEESMARIEKYWYACFKWWEDLTQDEIFWSLISERIRILDDPRLTTGFTRRMRATLPEALIKINTLLAIQYIEKGKLEQAHQQLAYMKESHQGHNGIHKVLLKVTEPLQIRIRDAVSKAKETAECQPKHAAEAAHDLFKAVANPLEIIKGILPPEDHERIDLCDAIAEAGLACSNAFVREEHDLNQCLDILKESQQFAESEDVTERIAEILAIAQGASLLDPIMKICGQVMVTVEEKPENAVFEANRLLSSAEQMLATLKNSNVSDEVKGRGQDEVAGTLMSCAVAYGNKTDNWETCIILLEKSLQIVASIELKDRIVKNLNTVNKNVKVFGNLKPISSAPNLSRDAIGFTLYGATDHDAETGSYLSTYYFVFFWIPIFPIRRYRVIPTSGGYRFLGKAPLRTFDKWHLFISIALITLFIFFIMSENNTGSNYQSSPSSSSPSQNTAAPPRSTYNSSARSTLSREIEDGKTRSKQMESQIQEMDNRLEDYKRKLNLYRASDLTEAYNALVPSYNSLVNERNNLYEEYSRLIEEVNSKVKRYNSGYR
jgi:hypothetical protein